MSGIFHLPILSNSAPTQGNGDYRVRFYDYDGTLLKEEWVQDAIAPTAPTLPTHENLTFYGWNKSFATPTKDMDVGAIYNSTHTYLYIGLTVGTGLTITVNFSKATTTNTTVYWGDGTSSTTTAMGPNSLTRVYTNYGNYVIRIESVGTITLGGGTTTNKMFNGVQNSTIKKVIVGEKVTALNAYIFQEAMHLSYVSLGSYITSLPLYCFHTCINLKHANVSSSVTYLSEASFYVCQSLKTVSLPETLVSIYGYGFCACELTDIVLPPGFYTTGTFTFMNAGIEKITIPPNITTVGTYAFNGVHLLRSLDFSNQLNTIGLNAFENMTSIEEFIFRSTTPPSLASTNAFNFVAKKLYQTKIFVPDASVNAYKTATNWVSVANYIYPLSQR